MRPMLDITPPFLISHQTRFCKTPWIPGLSSEISAADFYRNGSPNTTKLLRSGECIMEPRTVSRRDFWGRGQTGRRPLEPLWTTTWFQFDRKEKTNVKPENKDDEMTQTRANRGQNLVMSENRASAWCTAKLNKHIITLLSYSGFASWIMCLHPLIHCQSWLGKGGVVKEGQGELDIYAY